MTARLQPQRVPLGSVKLPGQAGTVPVYITLEWYRILQVLASGVTPTATPTPAPAPAPAPASSSDNEDVSPPQAAGLVIDFDYGPADMVPVLAIALEQGLQALQSETLVQQLQAQIAGLEARIEALEGSA